jgi:hypothetical protein
MNYYILDSITQDEDGISVTGHLKGKSVEIFYLPADDTDYELTKNGFVKCDASNWTETMVIEETAYSYLIAK